ncbi:hypothetical protein [Chloroflexus sp.]|uniref:hypothetical protein n=1 Tax=Chloroflexus sp. TaxID=1904827 RepID=UPI0002EDAEF1|nr:hypothetical protein [Chloroflexus sp.]
MPLRNRHSRLDYEVRTTQSGYQLLQRLSRFASYRLPVAAISVRWQITPPRLGCNVIF